MTSDEGRNVPGEPTPPHVHVGGDVSGTFVVGNENHLTVNPAPQPQRPQSADATTADRPRQQNSAEGHANLFAVTDGTMHFTVNQYGEDERSD